LIRVSLGKAKAISFAERRARRTERCEQAAIFPVRRMIKRKEKTIGYSKIFFNRHAILLSAKRIKCFIVYEVKNKGG
jgi:hypothetical protein